MPLRTRWSTQRPVMEDIAGGSFSLLCGFGTAQRRHALLGNDPLYFLVIRTRPNKLVDKIAHRLGAFATKHCITTALTS